MRTGVGGDPALRDRSAAAGRAVPGAGKAPDEPGPRRPLGVRIGHAFGVTSPRRAAILAVVVCAMALSVAVPLRNYVGQRSELAVAHEQQQILRDQVGELERRRALLADPSHIEAQARERLRYVRAGETPYVVQLPPKPAAPDQAAAQDEPEKPWFTVLWESIVGA
jgi:cell division protein FtsB